jgi:hypothetical protein
MPSRFDVNLKRFCVFHKQDFNTLAEVEVISIETHDPANMFKEFATSNHP